MESFTTQIEGGLDSADRNIHREILRTASDHIEVEPDLFDRLNISLNELPARLFYDFFDVVLPDTMASETLSRLTCRIPSDMNIDIFA